MLAIDTVLHPWTKIAQRGATTITHSSKTNHHFEIKRRGREKATLLGTSQQPAGHNQWASQIET